MFTGLVECLAAVADVILEPPGKRLMIVAPTFAKGASIGDRIAINGCCLTVIEIDGDRLAFQAGPETLERTNLGALTGGDHVNLERSLKVGDRLGGHIVQGHVDCTGRIVSMRKTGENMILTLAVAPDSARYIVEKGSIAIDGISLTVTTVNNGEFGVSVIPHSLNATTLRDARVGKTVNIETDIIGKYVEKLLHTKDGLTLGRLEELGF